MNDIDKKSRPLISVIVPVYKAEKYLDQCVKSIVDQTYRHLEIILVDDGSPDRCPQMCDDWAAKDSRIRVVHQTNKGSGAARNGGLDTAKGDLVGFVDSDDWIAHDMYESMYNNLLSADADIAYTASVHAYQNGKMSTHHLVPGVHLVLTQDQAFKYINLPGYFGIAPWDKLLKREIVGNLRFPEDTHRDEDYGFAYDTLDRSKKVVYDSSPKYFYRQNSGTLSNTASTVTVRAAAEVATMVELVRRKYVMQLPFALYAQLLAMLGIWDQVVISNQNAKPEWKAFRLELKQFIQENLDVIMKNVPLSNGRLIQIRLFVWSPVCYQAVFKGFKRIHPHRVG